MHTSSLILLPGSLCDQRLWQHQLAALRAEAAITVGDLTQDDSVAAMARRVLAGAPPRFALAGLSLGGIVALEVIRQAPERVQRLALLCTSPRPASEEQRAQWRRIEALVRQGHLRAAVRDILLPALLHPARRADAWLAQVVEDMARAVGAEAYLRQLSALAGRPDSQPSLGQIACPTLLIAGRADTLCPAALHTDMAAAIPGAQLAILEGCGHLCSLEQPSTTTALLRHWLSSQGREAAVAASDEA